MYEENLGAKLSVSGGERREAEKMEKGIEWERAGEVR